MIELARHIEFLLVENDCVIVPGFGGFIAHYVPAKWVAEENLFLPPTRIIGFNSRLKMNDGLLVQSYMETFHTHFSDANKMVERAVGKMRTALHEDGKVDLPNIGELSCSIYETYDFTPYDHKLTTPSLYGLDSFEFKKLEKTSECKKEPLLPANEGEGKKRLHLTQVAAIAAAILLLFFLSTPIEKTEKRETNYAQLIYGTLPEELGKGVFANGSGQSIHSTGNTKEDSLSSQTTTHFSDNTQVKKEEIVPVTVKEVKVNKQPILLDTSPTDITQKSSYHIIVASVGREEDAQMMAEELITKGYQDAKAIIGDGKKRVCIHSFTTSEEAYQALAKLRENEAFQDAWVLKK